MTPLTLGERRQASSSDQVPWILASNVETGLRLAMPTIVCAARWKTISTSCSPSARSRRARSQTSPRTSLTRSIRPDRTRAHRGTQSRTRQVISAPASSRRRTSQPPTSPVAPVTRTGLSRQKDFIPALLPPHLPGSRATGPQLVEGLVFAIGIHREEEAPVPIGHHLPLGGQPLQRLALQDAGVAVEVAED